MKLKEIFGESRIVGLAGEKSTGKTNNLMALLKDFRKENEKTEIYVYGLDDKTLNWVKKLKKVYEISTLQHLSNKRNCLIILDEFQRLKINDKRHKDKLNAFVDFIYHNNNWVILSSPNLREFNSIIGGKIEKWILKSVKILNLINGSQLKRIADAYNGRFKSLDDIYMAKNKILVINDDFEKIIDLEYIPEIDNKINHLNIFDVKKSEKKSEKKSR